MTEAMTCAAEGERAMGGMGLEQEPAPTGQGNPRGAAGREGEGGGANPEGHTSAAGERREGWHDHEAGRAGGGQDGGEAGETTRAECLKHRDRTEGAGWAGDGNAGGGGEKGKGGGHGFCLCLETALILAQKAGNVHERMIRKGGN